jgi:hypothetical protein
VKGMRCSIEAIDREVCEDFGTDAGGNGNGPIGPYIPILNNTTGYNMSIVNTASLVSVTDGVSWKRIRTFAVVVAGPGTFHR